MLKLEWVSNMKYAFDFLQLDQRPSKPRKTGLTAVRDRMRGLGEQREFLETYAQFVDFAKISNFAPRLYSETFLVEKLKLYQEYNLLPFFGGILFENAVAQGKADELAAYLRDIGAPAIEISNNILDLGSAEMASHIASYSDVGIMVFVEWGEKYPTAPMDPKRAAEDIALWTDAGATYVILERSEIDQLLMPDVKPDGIERMRDLAKLVGSDVLIFEAESQAQAVALIRGLGRDVNLGPNIDFELVKWLEPSRLGISREMGHLTIEGAAGRDGVRSRLEV
ncbi:phosphosulfolactate synthase [Epibacterium ulvae]|uniref:phosphosulfolactate synthase n=1 Tax=Epibacterium ulvae TaxID=1156985 RepID=UPI001BFC6CDD|nr:phosphosulfolactate synthase [Epibacterium ulvae]MBT8155591.1 phosphosulfolactate synthase [Epibacterium ulvae]